ncbi:MAG: lysophospholipid acyltransferase family protein [Gemmataceae bacterium]
MLPIIAFLFFTIGFFLDWKGSRLNLFDFLILRVSLVYSRLWHRWQSNRVAPFPRDRPCLVACNHTCSTDPMYILAACDYPIGFVVAHEHFRLNAFTHWVLAGIGSVPVRRGGNDPTALRRIMRRLEEGRILCLFPEGNLSNVRRGRLGHARLGIGYLALKTGLPVYPVYVHGGPRTDRLLPTWLFLTRRAAKAFFGKPVDLADLRHQPMTRKTIAEATHRVMDAIAALAPPQGESVAPDPVDDRARRRRKARRGLMP